MGEKDDRKEIRGSDQMSTHFGRWKADGRAENDIAEQGKANLELKRENVYEKQEDFSPPNPENLRFQRYQTLRKIEEKGVDRNLYEELDLRVPEQPNSSPTLQGPGSTLSRETAPLMAWTQNYQAQWKVGMKHHIINSRSI